MLEKLTKLFFYANSYIKELQPVAHEAIYERQVFLTFLSVLLDIFDSKSNMHVWIYTNIQKQELHYMWGRVSGQMQSHSNKHGEFSK